MNSGRNLLPVERVAKARLNLAMGDWVNSLGPWQVVAHMTFRWAATAPSAQRCFVKFMRSGLLSGVSYFYALEENPGRDGFHVHALWMDCLGVPRWAVWREWFETYGRGRIEPVRGSVDVCDYCAKYVTKEGGWWDLKLQQCREPGFQASFLAGFARKVVGRSL